jgi:hypothetical protein
MIEGDGGALASGPRYYAPAYPPTPNLRSRARLLRRLLL